MSDIKRNKKYSNKKETKRPIILTKRDGGGTDDRTTTRKTQKAEEKIQPKILIKVKEKEPTAPPISIATREQQPTTETSTAQSPGSITVQCKEKDPNVTPITSIEQPIQQIRPVAQMHRTVALVSSPNYQVYPNTSAFLMKNNTDFFVVGIIGCQGVGKTTIMNLLATKSSLMSIMTEKDRKDVYNYYFKEKFGKFSVKNKNGKSSSYPHTESVQMYITEDRMILLDCPPVLCNSYRKDATANELDDIKMLVFLLTACHLVIVVQDDYFDLSLMRLLQFAELAKPNQDNKSFVNDYLPNILFIKNNAKRNDFLADEKMKMELMLRHIFKNSQMKIFIGQSDKNKKSGKMIEHEKSVNYFLFPEIKDGGLTAFHPSLDILIMNLRNRVFMTPRNQIFNGSELTEAMWFELITSMTTNKANFFLTTYEEIRKSHTHSGAEQGTKGSSLNYSDVPD